jgi:AcrR family transcriptional regulator
MNAPQGVSTRAAQRVATRERLFKASLVEFKRAGLAEADIGAIVESAGVAHGTFFFHFPTKEHLLAELGQREEVRMAGELDRFLATPRDLSETLLEFTRLAAALERRLGVVLFKDLLALYFSPARPELDLWSDHPVITRVVDAFARVAEEHDLPADVDVGNHAMFFAVGLYGLLVIHDRNAARAEILEQFVTSSIRGLGIT